MWRHRFYAMEASIRDNYGIVFTIMALSSAVVEPFSIVEATISIIVVSFPIVEASILGVVASFTAQLTSFLCSLDIVSTELLTSFP